MSALGLLPTATVGCTESGLVKLAITPSPTKLKPAKLTLRATAAAGGKKDKDTFKLVCNPGRPTLATHVQPIFTANCTAAGCHAGQLPQSSCRSKRASRPPTSRNPRSRRRARGA